MMTMVEKLMILITKITYMYNVSQVSEHSDNESVDGTPSEHDAHNLSDQISETKIRGRGHSRVAVVVAVVSGPDLQELCSNTTMKIVGHGYHQMHHSFAKIGFTWQRHLQGEDAALKIQSCNYGCNF